MFVIVLYQIVLIYNEKKTLFRRIKKKKAKNLEITIIVILFPQKGGKRTIVFVEVTSTKKRKRIFYISNMKNILQNLWHDVTSGDANVANANRVPLTAHSFNDQADKVIRVATKVIEHFFSPIRALASKPTFTITSSESGKVIVNVFYYIANKDQALSDSTINNLGQVLSKLFKRPVELRFVRLHYPYLNSYILAQYIAINSNRYNFTRIQRAIFNALRPVKASSLADSAGSDQLVPAFITGMKIRVSGRLVTQRSVPRQTEQTAQIGSFSGQDNVIDYASFTSKNKKGAFTVKVWISQVPAAK